MAFSKKHHHELSWIILLKSHGSARLISAITELESQRSWGFKSILVYSENHKAIGWLYPREHTSMDATTNLLHQHIVTVFPCSGKILLF